ncbi:MAG: AAA family ATPase [Neptuniibacter sp.]
MRSQQAVYKPHPVEAFNGSPLIEAIRHALPLTEFAQAINVRPVLKSNLKTSDDFYRELSIELIDTTYTMPPDLYTLYKSCVKHILIGYLHRNPLDIKTKKIQYLFATEKDYCIPDELNLSKCHSVIGLSGAGKTLSVRKCLAPIPQVIIHEGYKDHEFIQKQIVWLEFEAPTNKTQRGFLLNFFLAVDSAVGTSYYDEWKKTTTVISVLIKEAKKIAYNHFIGLVFIDEIQRCVGTGNKADMATLSFIDNFFNDVGIPMIVAGTYQVAPLYKTAMSTTRRLTSGRTFYYNGIENDLYLTNKSGQRTENVNPNSFWNVFIDSLFHKNFLQNEFTFDIGLKEYIHYLTCGLPALVVRLVRLAYEEAISSGIETISTELLTDIYDDQFMMIHPALDTLRSGRYSEYEDLIDLRIFLENSEHIIDQQIQENIAFIQKTKNNNDDGLIAELEDQQPEDYIPANDLRNLKGLDRKALIKQLMGGRK